MVFFLVFFYYKQDFSRFFDEKKTSTDDRVSVSKLNITIEERKIRPVCYKQILTKMYKKGTITFIVSKNH